MEHRGIINIALGLLLAPFLLGVITRVKAWFAGRQGQPLLQLYFDLFKLFRKGAVFSRTTSWVFRAGPLVGVASMLAALALVPFGGSAALAAFPGDWLLLAYTLGLARFFTVIAALDTGSAFAGMGASREVLFAALAEPAFLVGLAVLARTSGEFSLSAMVHSAAPLSPELVLVLIAFGVVFLCENSRIPFDDPNTHLELTMIHEVMVLDHSGPDFALILYGAALKLWVLGAVVVGTALPSWGNVPGWPGMATNVAGMLLLAVGVGVIESIMARVRLLRVPQFLIIALGLAVFAFILTVQ
jgi:formate hydrogenlyase subunit 4